MFCFFCRSLVKGVCIYFPERENNPGRLEGRRRGEACEHVRACVCACVMDL